MYIVLVYTSILVFLYIVIAYPISPSGNRPPKTMLSIQPDRTLGKKKPVLHAASQIRPSCVRSTARGMQLCVFLHISKMDINPIVQQIRLTINLAFRVENKHRNEVF